MFIVVTEAPEDARGWPRCGTCTLTPPTVHTPGVGWRFRFYRHSTGILECATCNRYRNRTGKPRSARLRDQHIERDYQNWMRTLPTANFAAGILRR